MIWFTISINITLCKYSIRVYVLVFLTCIGIKVVVTQALGEYELSSWPFLFHQKKGGREIAVLIESFLRFYIIFPESYLHPLQSCPNDQTVSKTGPWDSDHRVKVLEHSLHSLWKGRHQGPLIQWLMERLTFHFFKGEKKRKLSFLRKYLTFFVKCTAVLTCIMDKNFSKLYPV